QDSGLPLQYPAPVQISAGPLSASSVDTRTAVAEARSACLPGHFSDRDMSPDRILNSSQHRRPAGRRLATSSGAPRRVSHLRPDRHSFVNRRENKDQPAPRRTAPAHKSAPVAMTVDGLTSTRPRTQGLVPAARRSPVHLMAAAGNPASAG